MLYMFVVIFFEKRRKNRRKKNTQNICMQEAKSLAWEK